MATSTAGTNATTTLPFALQWQKAGLSPADLATLRSHILDYRVSATAAARILPGALEAGQLFIPNRGVLKLEPGDWIAIGTTGWPFLIQSAAMTADFTHS